MCLPPTTAEPVKPKKVYYKEDDDESGSKSKRLSKRLSLFRSGDDGTDNRSTPTPRVVARGVVVQTFMGLAQVRNVRLDTGMCEVSVVRQVEDGGVIGGYPDVRAGVFV